MGLYELDMMPVEERVARTGNDAPRFFKRQVGGKKFLYRCNGNGMDGKWCTTGKENSIGNNGGNFLSSRAADLPSEPGLTWQFATKDGWQDDEAACHEVRGLQHYRPTTLTRPTYQHHRSHPHPGSPDSAYRSRIRGKRSSCI